MISPCWQAKVMPGIKGRLVLLSAGDVLKSWQAAAPDFCNGKARLLSMGRSWCEILDLCVTEQLF